MSQHDRGVIHQDAATIAGHLTGIERAMVIASGSGATHERIGRIERVGQGDGWISFEGACHDAKFDLGAVSRVVFDRTGGMKDRIIPRVEFRDAQDGVIFQVSALSGLSQFDLALQDLWPHAEPIAPAEQVAADQKQPPLTDEELQDCPSWAVLQRMVEGGRPVRISYAKPAFEQHWQGVITALRPAMGFINVMTPDFHLHLKGESVATWTPFGDAVVAMAADGQATGLRLEVQV